MALNFTKEESSGGMRLFWTLANGEAGEKVTSQSWGDRSVQFGGTFGSGGTVVLEGSNDGATFFTLNDPFGNAITATAASLSQVLETTAFVRPRVSAGDGATAITVSLFARRTFK